MFDTSQLFGAAAGAEFYSKTIAQSLRFNSGDSTYLSRTTGSATNTYTFSTWLKRGDITAANYQYIFSSGNSGLAIFKTGVTDVDEIYVYNGSTTTSTDIKVRDASSWYHIVFSVDAGTAAVYVNGVAIKTGISAASLSTSSGVTRIGRYGGGTFYFDGYLAETHLVTGSALTASSFGETKSGIWIPKDYTGSHGDDGFKLTYADTSAFGDDTSGEGHDLTANNFTASDQMLDTPTDNFATLNPLALASQNLNNGNLQVVGSTTAWSHAKATQSPATGKWYCETTIIFENQAASDRIGIGVINIDTLTPANLSPTHFLSQTADGWCYFENGQVWNAFANTGTETSYTTGDVIGMALDLDSATQTITWYKNNTEIVQKNLADGRWTFAITTFHIGEGAINFGQQDFVYTPPTDYLALSSANLPNPAIDPAQDESPEDYFNTVLYAGNGTAIGSGGKAVTGVGFQPDWTWIKNRDAADNHALYDVVRGVTKQLESDGTLAETTESEGLTAFGVDGFTLGNLAQVNTNTEDYVAWSWKANGSGVSNSDGSITSTVSANTTSGFSIAKYTGAGVSPTFGHGLGVAPELIIIKGITEAQGWYVFGDVIGASGSGDFVKLDSNAGEVTGSASSNVTWNSSTIGLDTNTGINKSAKDYICYAFHSVDGFSKIGTYAGNNATSGTFVYTGFRPSFIMVKSMSATTDWVMIDTARSTSNLSDTALYANETDTESTVGLVNDVDILSNGFKWRNNTGFVNDAQTYIFMAFAEQPIKYSNAR